MQADRSQISYDYLPVGEVLVLVYKSDKIDPGAIDPFRIYGFTSMSWLRFDETLALQSA